MRSMSPSSILAKMLRKKGSSEVRIRKEARTGFTLIELLIVVAVIVILSGLAIVNLLQATQRAKRAEAESFIAQLEMAISMYKVDTGRYPPDDRSSASLREALDPDPSDPAYDDTEYKGPYMEFKDKEVNSRGELLDPWHKGKDDTVHVYVYKADMDLDPLTVPPFHNTSSYDIYSKGFDGKTGDGFDAGNYCQNEMDDDGDAIVDELKPNGPGATNGYLEDDINNW